MIGIPRLSSVPCHASPKRLMRNLAFALLAMPRVEEKQSGPLGNRREIRGIMGCFFIRRICSSHGFALFNSFTEWIVVGSPAP